MDTHIQKATQTLIYHLDTHLQVRLSYTQARLILMLLHLDCFHKTVMAESISVKWGVWLFFTPSPSQTWARPTTIRRTFNTVITLPDEIHQGSHAVCSSLLSLLYFLVILVILHFHVKKS